MVTYMGIDPSLTGTAWVIIDEHGTIVSKKTLSPKERGIERLAFLRHKLEGTLSSAKPALVAVEGYAYNKGHAAHQIGEWGGILRLLLYDMGIPWFPVPPAKVKQYATGKGNANKPAVAVSVYRRWNVELDDDNQTDAYVLARIACAIVEGNKYDKKWLTGTQVKVLESIKGTAGVA